MVLFLPIRNLIYMSFSAVIVGAVISARKAKLADITARQTGESAHTF